jgi:nucleoside-diphosphate-sugar epimerase
MQTILGANGIISTEVAKALTQYTDKIRLVSRNPRKVNDTDEIFAADLTNPEQTLAAVAGSEIVFLTAGLQYNIKVWQEQWPLIMQNVIEACKKHKAKLVFFDNVYLYGKVIGWMTEETPVNPCSKKGKVREVIAGMLMNEIALGNITAMIVRAADFYGPNTPLSFATVMIFDNLAKGKKAQWMLNDSVKHSLTYTPDAGKATALLGNTATAYSQVWHLPTDRNALNGKEIIALVAKEFGVPPKHMTLPKWMLQLVGLFNPNVKESIEMLYQSESDYLFDSSKFDSAFNFPTTTYALGIAETVKIIKSKK